MDDRELDIEDELGTDDLERETEDMLSTDERELDTEEFDEDDDANIDVDENIELADKALLEDESTASGCAEEVLEMLDAVEMLDALLESLFEDPDEPPPHATKLKILKQ